MKIPWLYIGVGLIVAGVIGILVGLFLLRRERHLGAAKVQFARPSEMDLEPASKADDQWDAERYGQLRANRTFIRTICYTQLSASFRLGRRDPDLPQRGGH